MVRPTQHKYRELFSFLARSCTRWVPLMPWSPLVAAPLSAVLLLSPGWFSVGYIH